MNVDLAYSRPQKAAEQLGELAEDRHRFLNKQVLLTGEPEILETANGQSCFLNSLRLLPRICSNVNVAVPKSCRTLREVARRLSQRIAFGNELRFVDEISRMDRFDAILSVGSAVCPELPWTTIYSNGWLARVSSGNKPLPAECGQANPIGALAAASLGVGEVFKRLIRLKPERGELVNGLHYSLRTYSTESEDYGPELPAHFDSDLLVIGAGAIGNALVHLIGSLPFTGTVGVVDWQEYRIENLGTCILMGPGDLWKPKAEMLASHLRLAGIDTRDFYMSFEQYTREFYDVPIVLNGLDNIATRHDVQRALWPDVLIDGAIGDFTCQVSRHPRLSDVACLKCLFQKTQTEKVEKLQSRAIGLLLKGLGNHNAVITQRDIDNAPDEKREFLGARIGHTFSSVIQEVLSQQILEEPQPERCEPSLPFVACFSACMVMAEAVAHLCGWTSELAPRYQFDFLTGPTCGQMLPQQRRPECVCVRRKTGRRSEQKAKRSIAS